MKRIASFSVDHTKLMPGMYVSRIDGDITTYDLRQRRPNCGDYLDNATLHTFEHLFATFIRNSEISDSIIYFGPMGCQTGAYLLVRNADNMKVFEIVKQVLRQIIDHEGEIYGAAEAECGNYKSHDLAKAKEESKRYLEVLENIKNPTFEY